MSNHWPTTTVGELFEIGAGKSVTPASRHGEPRYPFLRTANIFWGRIDLTEVDSMQFSAEEIATKSLRKGDLLVCEGGDIGRSAIWNDEITNCGFQNHLHRLRPKSPDVVPRFFMYYLQAGFTQLGIYEGAGNKTTIPNLSRSRLAALEVPEPPKPEQEKIAATLWKAQRAIAVEEKLIATARELKQSAMGQLFSRGLRGELQKETELGPVPQSWAVVALGDVCGLSTGTTPSTKRADYYLGDVPFIKTSEIVNNRISSTTTFVSRKAVADYNLRIYPPGTVLMAMYGQGKTRGQVALLQLAATTTQNAAALEPSEDVDSSFLWQYLLSNYERLRGMGSLGHLSHLNLGYLREFSMVKPTISEQREIAAILEAIDQKIDLHERRRTTLRELFETLLHQLMTGKIRVDKLDIDTSEVAAA